MIFKDQVALITASSTGIGLAIAHKLAEQGAIVIVTSRNQKNVDEAVNQIKAKGLKAEGIVCHAAKKTDREKVLKHIKDKYGKIDILVPNAAASTQVGPNLDITEEQYDKMFEINVKSTFFLIKEASPLLVDNQSKIIIITSYIGFELSQELGIYGVTKTTLIALTKVLSKELAHRNIRVNAVAPGLIKTKFSSLLWEGKEEQVKKSMGINRLGETRDIANIVSFLASEDSSYITGEIIQVSGKSRPGL